ncbi:TonB-dependent receptor plug domain-containing protein [Alteromonas sp. H39]|uniref:TonB-dependent receptor plug domain-containing protein n=1 Tax=Alteromonas sp. H39 TaxID=3389876 RepID=UPI0039E12AF8
MTKTHARLVAPLAAALFSYSGHSLAQTQNEIETLTVTGTHLPFDLSKLAASVSVLSAEDIQASGATQITDLLRGLPGVSIAASGSPGSLTEIRLRGSESNHLLVLIDGVIANDIGQGSLVDLAHLTTANVQRIELLRGPQSALWGSGAVGGVLSITTSSGNNKPGNHVTAHAGIGTQQTWQGGVNATTQHEDTRFTVYADYLKTAGDNISRQGPEDDGYKNLTAGLNLNTRLTDEHSLTFTLRSVDYENEYDATDFTTGLPADADNVTEGSQLTSKVNWQYSAADSGYQSDISIHWRSDDADNMTSGTDAGGTTGERMQFQWLNRFETENGWQLAVGLEYLQRFFEQRGPTDYGDPNQHRHDTTSSVFGEAGKQFTDSITATLSARYDDNTEFDDAFSARAGATWQLDTQHALFASIGQAVKNPTFTERFGYYPGSFIGNPDLEPEVSREIELGLRANWDNVSAEVSTYFTQLEDEILGYVFVPDLGATALNAGSDSERRGIDSSLNWALNGTDITLSYSYLDASQDSGAGDITELRRARHQGAVTVRSNFDTDKFTAYAKLAYTGSRLDTFYPPYPAAAQTIGLHPYTLVTLNAQYQIDALWSVNLRINNAFNAGFEDIVGYRGDDRSALLSITLQY